MTKEISSSILNMYGIHQSEDPPHGRSRQRLLDFLEPLNFIADSAYSHRVFSGVYFKERSGSGKLYYLEPGRWWKIKAVNFAFTQETARTFGKSLVVALNQVYTTPPLALSQAEGLIIEGSDASVQFKIDWAKLFSDLKNLEKPPAPSSPSGYDSARMDHFVSDERAQLSPSIGRDPLKITGHGENLFFGNLAMKALRYDILRSRPQISHLADSSRATRLRPNNFRGAHFRAR